VERFRQLKEGKIQKNSVLEGHQHAGSYNTRQLHSALGHMGPTDFEEDRMKEASVA